MTVQEASYLWWFDSHNNLRHSRWLQSTLSELEEKTKGMLKLIEGDADTFAQRAEMYYRKRPELVSMIEDFYRAYRSLAERYDQLKLESGTSSSNQGWFHKEWSSTDKLSESSSVTFDSEVSEVDDPESEEDQVESKLTEVPKKESGSDRANLTNEEVERHKARFKEDISDLFTDSVDSGLFEVSYPESEEAQVESKLREFPEKKSGVNLMTEEVQSIERKVRNTASKYSEVVYGEPEEAQDESNLRKFSEKERDSDLLNLFIEEAERIKSKIKNAAEKSSESSFDFLKESVMDGLEVEEAQVKSKLREVQEKKSDNDVVKLISEVQRLKEENVTFKAELERKDEEKREVIRQLSLSVDILKEENDSLRKFMKDTKKWGIAFEFKKLKGIFSGKLFGSHSNFQTTLVAL